MNQPRPSSTKLCFSVIHGEIAMEKFCTQNFMEKIYGFVNFVENLQTKSFVVQSSRPCTIKLFSPFDGEKVLQYKALSTVAFGHHNWMLDSNTSEKPWSLFKCLRSIKKSFKIKFEIVFQLPKRQKSSQRRFRCAVPS